jgi:hypothetical protein
MKIFLPFPRHHPIVAGDLENREKRLLDADASAGFSFV